MIRAKKWQGRARVTPDSAEINTEKFIAAIVFVLAIGLGGFLRLQFMNPDFPLLDGGLFYNMTDDIAASNFTIPRYTTYNGTSIPFAYPPLSFYLAALLTKISGWTLLRVFSVLPVVISTLTIPVAYVTMGKLLRSKLEAAVAVLIFAVLPRSFSWTILGGGVARSLGLLFSLLTLSQVISLYTTKKRLFVLTTALMASLTLLSHAEWGWFTFFTTALLLLFYGRNVESLVNSILASILVVVLTAPWWGTVVSNHGMSPFLSAFHTSEALQTPFKQLTYISYNFTDEPMLGVIATLGLLGVFVCLAERRWFLSAWLIMIFLLNQRSAGTTSSIVVSMMVAIALNSLILPALLRLSKTHFPEARDHSGSSSASSKVLDRLKPYLVWMPGSLLVLGLTSYMLYGSFRAGEPISSPLRVLDEAQREAMYWVAANTPEDSRVLVITSSAAWELDTPSEWFPVLAERTSVATVQGTEWLPGNTFQRSMQRYFDLQWCAAWGVECLETWAEQGGSTYSHVYLGPNVTGAVGPSLRSSPDYQLIYDQDRVRIFERKSNPGTYYIRLGDQYRDQLLFEAAIDAYQTALGFEPLRSEAYFGLGEAYFWLEDWDHALSAFQDSLAHEYPSPSLAYRGMGWSYYNLEDYDEAIGAFEEAVGKDPYLADGFGGLGWTWLQKGDCVAAIPYFERAIDLDSESSGPRQGLQECRHLDE